MHDISHLWLDTAQAALSFVSEPPIGEKWTCDSALPEMTVGVLSGHLLHSGILLLEDALNTADQPEASTDSAATLFSQVPLDEADPVHADVRSVAAGQSNEGQTELAARTAASIQRISRALERGAPERVVAFLGAFPMTLDELLRARILELVVHLDDLTCSVGVTGLSAPREAIALTCHLGIEIDMQRYGPQCCKHCSVGDRAAEDALRTF